MTLQVGARGRSASSHPTRTPGPHHRGTQHAQVVSSVQRSPKSGATPRTQRSKRKPDDLTEERWEGRRQKKTGRYKTQQERWCEQLMRARKELEDGLRVSSCRLFLTLVKTRIKADGTKGRDYNPDHRIRCEVWHLAWSEVKQQRRWPNAEAYTVMEYARKTGVHLHVVVRDAPGLTATWIKQAIARRYPDFTVHTRTVWDEHGLAGYLTKTLADPEARGQWGRYTHITSKSHEWIRRK